MNNTQILSFEPFCPPHFCCSKYRAFKCSWDNLLDVLVLRILLIQIHLLLLFVLSQLYDHCSICLLLQIRSLYLENDEKLIVTYQKSQSQLRVLVAHALCVSLVHSSSAVDTVLMSPSFRHLRPL